MNLIRFVFITINRPKFCKTRAAKHKKGNQYRVKKNLCRQILGRNILNPETSEIFTWEKKKT